MREALKINAGERYELCKAFHAEQNAVLGADPSERRGGTLYLYGENTTGEVDNAKHCMMYRRMIGQGAI